MSDQKMHYYFAYGMNTNPDVMDERLNSSGIAQSLGPARLHGWKFRFAYHADVVPEPGEAVDGVLWNITQEHLDRLDVREGFPHYYNREIFPVECMGILYQAQVYYMNDGEFECPPNEIYWNMLERGYDHFGIYKGQMYRALESSNLTEWPYDFNFEMIKS